MTYEVVRRLLKQAGKAAGYNPAHFRAYTFRKSGTKCGARCGAAEWDLKNTGRWKNRSEHFFSYIEEGGSEKDMYQKGNTADPIRSLWVYKPTSYYLNCLHPELK